MLNAAVLGNTLKDRVDEHVSTLNSITASADANTPVNMSAISAATDLLFRRLAAEVVIHFQGNGQIINVQVAPGIVITGSSPSGPVSGSTTAPGIQLGTANII